MESLLNFQLDSAARIARAEVNYKKSPKARITKEYVQSRLEALEQSWSDFLEGHKNLLKTGDPTALKQSEYIKNDLFNTTEDAYINYKSELKTVLNTFMPSNVSNESFNVSNKQYNGNNNLKLPKINIPMFSGIYTEWITFRDLFLSLIHNNSNLDGVQKLHYLKGYLTGEAQQLLRNIPITESNYERCWDQLEKRYNNKKYLCNCLLKRLLSQKSATTESAVFLKDLLDTTTDCLSALSNLSVPVDKWDLILIHILSLKLDTETRKQWELNIADVNTSNDLPSFEQFKTFLQNRYRALEFVDTRVLSRGSNLNINKANTLHVSVPSTNCEFCLGDHKLITCQEFSAKDCNAKRDFVQTKGLCFNCLGNNHSAKFCRNPVSCRICKRRHHTLIHPKPTEFIGSTNDQTGPSPSNNTEVTANAVCLEDEKEPEQVVTHFAKGTQFTRVLLATALVKAEARSGMSHTIRALIDQGSQASFITESSVQLLGLKKTPIQGQISGVGSDNKLKSNFIVTVNLRSCINPNFAIRVQAYVLRSITTLLPNNKTEVTNWPELRELDLADPLYYIPNKIDILLGAEVFCQILNEGVKRSPSNTVIAQATFFGWIISGFVCSRLTNGCGNIISAMHVSLHDNELLKRFWELEEITTPTNKRLFTEEESKCEEIYAETTKRDSEGRYIVKLPFRNANYFCLEGNSREIALKRFYSTERKLENNKRLKIEFQNIFKEYLALNHMEKVPIVDTNSERSVYLPYHAVLRDDKSTTKVRIVFDASCKGTNGISLNDELMVGPTLQSELRHLITRWRTHPICLVADIVKMYRQVKVYDEDVNFQRILWRDDPNKEVEEYRLLRVTFGTSCAPYLAVKTLLQVAIDNGVDHPLASERVLKDFYIDDFISGCQDVNQGIKIYVEMCELLKKGGFVLQKWSSNSEELIKAIRGENKAFKTEEKTDANKDIKIDSVMKTLGLTWNRHKDVFKYTVKTSPVRSPVTKRFIVSDISKLFDPLGWVAPVIIKAKILIQSLWLAGVTWDEEVPTAIKEKWITYRLQLNLLENIEIPRWFTCKPTDTAFELHGYCDASKVAYAAVVYSRHVDEQGNVRVVLVAAKTKVAPVKQVSIPRLELCGAVLLSKLLSEAAEVLTIPKSNIHAWTDSTVVLAWINDHPSRWKTFIANRVSEILTNLEPHQWAYVKSEQNPADCASRGLEPSELLKATCWFQGPTYLYANEIEYKKPKYYKTDLEEAKHVFCSTLDPIIIDKYSSLTKLVRVIAYCRRFLHLLKPNSARINTKILSSQEIHDSLTNCIKISQAQLFKDELISLRRGDYVNRKSKLYSLNPFLDDKNILRVGGRLQQSNLSESRKHPIILSKSQLAHLIISDVHHKTLHGGPQLMLAVLSSNYWIIGGKQLIKSFYRKCVTCFRQMTETRHQLMGQLPSARVTPVRTFKRCGVDYAGPVNIRTSKGRGFHAYKGYICLFICMATRAVHIEAVSDLTTQGFLAAYKRFVARRGHCSDIWSDNGTNFLGASRELQAMFASEKANIASEIVEQLATQGTEWHFIPPHAPNFGGLWESGIRSVKGHLKRVIGETKLTYEELATVLTQVEACLNSRPLSRIDDNNLEYGTILTPGHFIIGESLITVPDNSYESSNISSLRRWQLTQRMVQIFWRKWSHEYLRGFLQRHKWSIQRPEPEVDDIVLIKEDDLPPCRWLLGKVIKKHPGPDNITRVVTLRTKNSVFKRPTSKLGILPIAK